MTDRTPPPDNRPPLQPPEKSDRAERDARRAAALRANLRRRKGGQAPDDAGDS